MKVIVTKIKKTILNIFGLSSLNENKSLKKELSELRKRLIYTPGHYYSPYPSDEAINSHKIINYKISGIELNKDAQISLLSDLKLYYKELNWSETKTASYNYFYNNPYFSYSDAIFLHCICMHFKPKKIIEVGSGYSSAAMLDINKLFFDNEIELTFIEPYPEERLFQLVEDRSHVIVDFIQNIPLESFKNLQENDILFIDTSHVSKFQSDVNHIIFNILPTLNSGVIIHIHDIFYPFEYPIEWLKKGRAWNETYLLRAFLQYNNQFEILLFSSYLEQEVPEWFQQNMPLCLNNHEYMDLGQGEQLINTKGQSIYLRKK